MNLQPRHIAWIAVDWGTTHLRVYAMSAGGDVLDEASSSDGMAGLNRDDFEPALLRLIEPWLNAGIMQVLACGMVGARQGWVEAPYNSPNPFQSIENMVKAVSPKTLTIFSLD